MYWWHVNNAESKSLIQRCYKAQKSKPVKKDWVNDVENDKTYLNITLEDNELKTISKDKFKKLVKSEAKKKAVEYLTKLKTPHSKMDGILFTKLETHNYLKDKRLNTSEVKLLFKLRTRMFNCKENFKNQYKNEEFLYCPLCIVALDSQSHLFDCFVLTNSIIELRQNKTFKYDHIFKSIEQQVPGIKLLKIIVEKREVILEKQNLS